MTSELPMEAQGLPVRRPWTRYVAHALRILLGLPLLVGGLNGLLHFLPEPQPVLPPGATAFVGALVESGYMLPLIAVTHALVGLLLVFNRFVPLALVLLAPFLVNALLFHLFLEPSGLPVAGAFMVVELLLMWCYRAAYRPLFTPHAVPTWG